MTNEDPTDGDNAVGGDSKFLCGHDERHWFVAAVPGAVPASIDAAKDALKPKSVIDEQNRLGQKKSTRNRRRNPAFVRQGEWFFILCPDFEPPSNAAIHQNEPLARNSRSKPHRVQFVYRSGGESVWVSRQYPTGLNDDQYRNILKGHPERRKDFRMMVRNSTVFARGLVRHPDHATVKLRFWHRVEMNREAQAPGVSQVAFLD